MMNFRFYLNISFFLLLFAQSFSYGQNFTDFGFYRVSGASPRVAIGDPIANGSLAFEEALLAEENGSSVLVLPELYMTGYSAEDLFATESLLVNTKKALLKLMQDTKDLEVTIVVGAPYRTRDGRLYNVAFVISGGQIIGAVPKIHLPNYREFYEKRWFISGKNVEKTIQDPILGEFHLGTRQLFQIGEMILGIEICEDLWAPLPPSTNLAINGANVLVNLSASNELVAKSEYRKALISQQSERLLAAYVYVSSGPTESTKDVVFGGHTLIFENGSLLKEGRRFQMQGERISADIDIEKLLHERQTNTTFGCQEFIEEIPLVHTIAKKSSLSALNRTYSKTPFIPSNKKDLAIRAEEIMHIQATGLARRMLSAKLQKLVIGISGGLDSTLALLVANEAMAILGYPASSIIGVTMPGFGTTSLTKNSAHELMKSLGVQVKEISISPAVNQHFTDIGHDPKVLDVTYENSQARERTQILFDLANQEGAVVVGTGDLSELCLGWCTYNGDHMSNYSVNASVPKTLVKFLIDWYANGRADEDLQKTLQVILNTEISPELLPPGANGQIQQVTEDVVGPYILHDFFIYHYLRNGFSCEKIYTLALKTFEGDYSPALIKKWLRVFIQRFYTQQFKRTTLPAGPKVGSVSVSPRGDLRLPDEASFLEILKRIDALE